MAKIVCVLYDDPVDGYPPTYARDDIPKIEKYPDGQTTPTPSAIDFSPGELLGCVSGELGLRKFLEDAGHELVVTADKDGEDSEFDQNLARRRGGDLTALLARLSDRRADRQGAEPEDVDHRGDRLGSRRPPGGDRQRDHRRRGHLLQLDQRLRARGDDDPGVGAQLHPLLQDGRRRRLEHRRLRLARVRPRGHAGRHRRRRPDRHRRAPAPEAVRRRAPLHRPPPPPVGGRGGARRHLPRDHRGHGRGVRRGHDQRPAPSRDREPVRRADALADEARRLPDQHRARQDLRPRRDRPRARVRAARRLRRRRLVPAAGAAGPPLADDALARDDPAHVGLEPLGPGPLRRGDEGDPRVPLRGQADPRGVPDRGGRQARRRRCPLLQRGLRHRGLTRRRRASAVSRRST